MPEGLGPREDYNARQLREEHKNLNEEKEALLKSAEDHEIKATKLNKAADAHRQQEPDVDIAGDVYGGIRDKAVKHYHQAAEEESEASELNPKLEANLWRAKQHVDRHLPEYKQTAAQEMKTESGKEFEPGANDAEPARTEPRPE
jgi:hypothetical protein